MLGLNVDLVPFSEWLVRTTVQGTVVICLILFVKTLLRDRLPIRWHYWLWLLLLLRIFLPWAPKSKLSIFNFIPASLEVRRLAPSDAGAGFFRFVDILPYVWLIGALILAGFILLRSFRLWRIVKRERPITNEKILDLLEDCKMEMRIQTIVGVVVSDRIKSPALFGFIRPRLLLPEGMIERHELDELRYIFIHELSHLKQRDIYLSWLMTLFQVVYWFNPLMWFAIRRIRLEREFACDGLALSMLSADEPPRYGHTIVNLLEKFSQVSYVPSVAGIVEDTSQIERRIKMIAQGKRPSRMQTVGAMLLVAGLGLFTLTDAYSGWQGALAEGPSIQWEKTFGGSSREWGCSLQQTSDAGYIIAGQTDSYGAGWTDVYLIKTDPAGNPEWDKTFGGGFRDAGWSVSQTTDGGYIIGGFTDSSGAGSDDAYLIKIDSAGNIQWEKTFGGSVMDQYFSARQTSDGGYVIMGWTMSYGAGSRDFHLIKTDSDGNMQWDQTYGGSGDDWGVIGQQTSDGGYVIVGGTTSFGAGAYDVYLIKTDSDGNQEWQKTFGAGRSDGGLRVQQTDDDGYIITGFTWSYGAGRSDVYLIKTDSDGNAEWEKTFGGSDDAEVGWAVEQTTDGGYIIGGGTNSPNIFDPIGDVYLIKTDSAGNLLWEMAIGGSEGEQAGVHQTSDGGYIAVGWTKSYGAGDWDVYLIKLAPD